MGCGGSREPEAASGAAEAQQVEAAEPEPFLVKAAEPEPSLVDYVLKRRTSVQESSMDSERARLRYSDTHSLETQLRTAAIEQSRRANERAITPVKLLRASWLIKQADAGRRDLPDRRTLESLEPEAFAAGEELDEAFNEIKVAAKNGTAVMWYPPIIVLSYPWRSREHPDPSGSLLQMVAQVLEWYLSERARLQQEGVVKHYDVGVFIDFWSLLQCRRDGDEVERAIFEGALMSMDAWFGHAGTVTLLMTRPPADWGEVPEERLHESRGWCFFERHVSSLAKVATHVLDGGLFDRGRLRELYPHAAGCGDGGFGAKDAATLAAQATGEDRADMPFLASLIRSSRRGPLHPEQLAAALDFKAFTVEADRARVVQLYENVAHGVLRSTTTTSFDHVQWEEADFAHLGYTLKLCRNLEELRLSSTRMDAAGLAALLRDTTQADLPALERLHLKDNPLGDAGLQLLAEALRTGLFPRLGTLLLRGNAESETGRAAVAAACAARGVQIGRAKARDWAALRPARQTAHRERLARFRGGAGKVMLGTRLSRRRSTDGTRESMPAEKELSVSRNEVRV